MHVPSSYPCNAAVHRSAKPFHFSQGYITQPVPKPHACPSLLLLIAVNHPVVGRWESGSDSTDQVVAKPLWIS